MRVNNYERRRCTAVAITVLLDDSGFKEEALVCREMLNKLPEHITKPNVYAAAFSRLNGLIQFCIEIARKQELPALEQFITQETNRRYPSKHVN